MLCPLGGFWKVPIKAEGKAKIVKALILTQDMHCLDYILMGMQNYSAFDGHASLPSVS